MTAKIAYLIIKSLLALKNKGCQPLVMLTYMYTISRKNTGLPGLMIRPHTICNPYVSADGQAGYISMISSEATAASTRASTSRLLSDLSI